MKLSVFPRENSKKSTAKKIKREGGIPSVIYSNGGDSEAVFFKKSDFEKILRKLKPGRLATTVFTLEKGNDKFKAMIKDSDYDVTSYDVIHVDFQKLSENEEVMVKVPIEFINVAECLGVKLGGILRQVIKRLKVKCLPKNIPEVFQLDVKNLKPLESKKLSDLDIPQGVTPMAKMDGVIAIVAKR